MFGVARWISLWLVLAVIGMAPAHAADLRQLGPQLCTLAGSADASPAQVLSRRAAFDCGPDKLEKATFNLWIVADIGAADEGLGDPVLRVRTSRHGAFTLTRQYADGRLITTDHSLADQTARWRAPYAVSLPYMDDAGVRPETILLKIDNPFDPTNWYDIELAERADDIALHNDGRTVSALVMGLLFAPLLLNGVFFLALRQKFILFHTMMVCGLIVNHIAWSGIIFDLFPHATMAYRSITVYLALGWVAMSACLLIGRLCSRELMGTAWLRALHIAGLGCCAITFAIILASPWLPFVGAQIIHIAFGAMVLTVVATLARNAIKGDRMAMLQMMGLAGVGLVAVSRVLRANGVIADLPIVDLGFYIAVLIEAFTTSVVVALRALSLRRQRDMIAQERDRILQLAQTDELTGIPNRRAFINRFDAIFSRPDRRPGLHALMIIDIDHFKLVNDRFGHSFGDAILRQFAARLRDACRAEDIVARFGGEEFVALARFHSEARIRAFAERLCHQHLRWTEEVPDSETLEVSCSIGVAILPRHNTVDLGSAFATADEALYQAKDNGRRQVWFASKIPAPPMVQPRSAAA
ncbi:MAG: hypothetical protein C0510_02350 [Erythrobacter sp.]|nr:hypothetical protein [Erythrobacter sp.]